MAMDAAPVGPPPLPLTVLIPGVGLVGGAAGGLAVGALLTILNLIQRGTAEVWFLALMFGLIAGTVAGLGLGVAASLTRILIGMRFGLTGELVAVVAGAVGATVALCAITGSWSLLVYGLPVSALAGWQFCRTILKRARQDAPNIPDY